MAGVFANFYQIGGLLVFVIAAADILIEFKLLVIVLLELPAVVLDQKNAESNSFEHVPAWSGKFPGERRFAKGAFICFGYTMPGERDTLDVNQTAI